MQSKPNMYFSPTVLGFVPITVTSKVSFPLSGAKVPKLIGSESTTLSPQIQYYFHGDILIYQQV